MTSKPLSANRPKRHHFVPEMILHRFTDEDGKLHLFNRKAATKGVISVTPKNAFSETHLYSEILDDGSRNPDLEERLAVLEGAAARVVEKIVVSARAGEPPQLTDEEHNIWTDFFILQWSRAPDVSALATTPEEFNERFDSIVRELKENQPDEIQAIHDLEDPDTRRKLIHNVKCDAVELPKPRIKALLMKRGLGVARIVSPTKSFIVASLPMAVISFGDGDSLLANGSEVWWPIASDVAIGLGSQRHRSDLFTISDHALVRRLNMLLARQSTMFASRSKSLTDSLARATL